MLVFLLSFKAFRNKQKLEHNLLEREEIKKSIKKQNDLQVEKEKKHAEKQLNYACFFSKQLEELSLKREQEKEKEIKETAIRKLQFENTSRRIEGEIERKLNEIRSKKSYF